MNDSIRLKDLKGRKGHICLGGEWATDEGPVCGCGALLHTLPDFMDRGPYTGGEQPATPPASPTWEELRQEMSQDDALATTGQEVATRHDEPDMAPAVPPIDPTQPYGPVEVEKAILDAVQRLERGLKHEAYLIAATDQLKIEYELAYARAVRDSQGGAADTRKADAVLRCEHQYRSYMDACAARDAMKAVTHTLRSTLSGLQSVGRSVGVSYQGPQGRGQ